MFLMNGEGLKNLSYRDSVGFNPLNQVYVFNENDYVLDCYYWESFNPLNQVYVFNLSSKNEECEESEE